MKLLPQFKDDFARNVLTLLSGTVLAQLLSLLVAPLLTWYYLPEDMAVAEMYLRVVLLLAVAATARYEMAIVLPKLNEDAISLVKLCLMITIGVSVLSLGLILVGGEKLVNYLELPGLTDYLFIIPVSVLIAGGYQSLNYWQIRNKFYRNISTANISSALVNNGVKLSVGVASSLGPLGLILGNLLGQFVGLLLFLGKSLKYLISPGNQESSIPGNAKVYKNFPLVNMPHAFTDAIRELVIITIILYYFGGVTMGIYAFVVRVLKMPIALVGSSMSQVFFQEASEKYANNEDILPIVKRTLIPLLKIGVPILLIFMYFGDDLIQLVFNEKWADAGVFAQILAPWLFFNFLISPISQIPIIVNKQKEVFLFSLIGFGTSVAALVIGNSMFDIPEKTFMLFSAVQSVYLFSVILWTLSLARNAKMKHS